MGCFQTLIQSTVGWDNEKVSCECPPVVSLDELTVKPFYCTPIDRLGFPRNCCCCCSTRVASGFICILSFFWAGIEIHSADKFMTTLFPERGTAFYYCKMVYLIICMGFLMSCACLLFGVVIRREQPVHWFVWYGFFFNIIAILLTMGGTLCSILNTGDISKMQTFKLIFALIWWMLFMYFLMVVNSYKLSAWYHTLGFKF